MVPTLVVILTCSVLYWFPIRRWMSRWGATASDLTRVMAGDVLLVNPTYSGTMAVTVAARPEHIWPWLVQIGYQRGGLYSYDWLDCLFGFLDRPSATCILPELFDFSPLKQLLQLPTRRFSSPGRKQMKKIEWFGVAQWPHWDSLLPGR